VTNIMIFDINMFGVAVVKRVSGDSDCRCIVAESRHLVLDTKFAEELRSSNRFP
jgi:hypothetical protein